MIPAEAVEAARKVAFERYGAKPDAAYLRTILEAAAPHMQVIDRDGLRKILDAGSPHHRSANDAEVDALVETIITAGWHL